MVPAGKQIGPYEIVSLLGAGGMGEVYRARDSRLGRTVALKVLPPDIAGDPGRRQRFEQEARAASALNHPNILSVYDTGTQDGLVYIVSELIEGESLRPGDPSALIIPSERRLFTLSPAFGCRWRRYGRTSCSLPR